ncbi:hypothetical protein [Bacillus sp. AG4(2022)]|jgi:hypothetical protein|uniref:hypothetical protein n=1 Tax=Bacillus sp. AG4(2022) TaxID=2962594 RepID=UPI0028814B20|nr:hypothetical protein [Bacillus sp. AG4(2022)]MDT0161411.1 hypothetical protein [Bacillus sp. AG4(2022)]
MTKSSSKGIERGQTIAFRVPSDTPEYLVKQLQKLKEAEKRNFSSRIADYVMQGVSQSVKQEQETVTIPLPKALSKMQRDWLKHEHSEALLGSIIYQLITDPVRSAALLASLNSKSTDIDEALYLQERKESEEKPVYQADVPPPSPSVQEEEEEIPAFTDGADDDLDDIDWSSVQIDRSAENEDQEEESMEDLLGDFLAHMNK